MRKRRGLTWVGGKLVLLPFLTFGSPRHAIAEPTPDALFTAASPAVVKLTVKDERNLDIGTGSGFVVAFEEKVTGEARHFESTIITNYHVVYPAVNIGVLFPYQGTGKAVEVVVEDPSADVAVLAVRSSGSPKQVLKLCEGAEPLIGTKVYTIGSPLGLTNTLSEGLVSGYRERDGGARWMQISAPISPGSSGGPVVSVDGCVLGMTTATRKDGQNLNFAIPAKEISRVLNAPKKPREVWEGASTVKTEQRALWEAVSKMQERCAGPAAVEPARQIAMFGLGEAIERLDECLRAGVRDADQLALLLTGWDLSFKKRYDEAVAMLKRAADANPGEFAYLVHYELGQAVVGARLKYEDKIKAVEEQAIPSWIKAKELRPDFAPTRDALGNAYHILHRYPEALVEAESVVSLLPRCYEGYELRGRVWAELGRREAFERDFEQAIILRSNDPGVYYFKANCYEKLKDLDSAIEAHRQTISIDEDFRDAHVALVYLYTQLGQCEKAMEHYEKAVRLGGAGVSDGSDERTQEGLMNLGIKDCWARTQRSP